MSGIGKLLIAVGGISIAVGLVLMLAPKIPWLGGLPGDIIVKKENVIFYFPVTTCVIISVIISAILFLISKK